jgi:peptide/nickel transport system permease protein
MFVMLIVTVITFVLLHALPGGPARALLGAHYTPDKYQSLNHQLGLDRPLVVQYAIWVWNLVRGDFGYSWIHQLPVRSLIGTSVTNSSILAGLSIAEAVVVAIPLGVYQALRPRTWTDSFLTTINFVLYSMPIFFIGSIAILYLAVKTHIFPPGGIGGAGDTNISVGSRLYHALLPSFVLAVVQMAAWSRYMRSSMLDAVVQDYMRTARAKGLSLPAAVWKHGFRNALLPVITLIGLSLPTLIGGVVVVESVFNYPGMGYLLWQGAQQYDFPVVLGVTLVAAFATIVGNWIADVLYAIADPRIREATI